MCYQSFWKSRCISFPLCSLHLRWTATKHRSRGGLSKGHKSQNRSALRGENHCCSCSDRTQRRICLFLFFFERERRASLNGSKAARVQNQRESCPLRAALLLTIALAWRSVENKWIKCNRWAAANVQRHNIAQDYVGSITQDQLWQRRCCFTKQWWNICDSFFFFHQCTRSCPQSDRRDHEGVFPADPAALLLCNVD